MRLDFEKAETAGYKKKTRKKKSQGEGTASWPPPRSHRSCINKPLSPPWGRHRCPSALRLLGTRRWTRTRADRKEPARRRPAPRGPAHAAASRRPGLARGSARPRARAGRRPTLPGSAARAARAARPRGNPAVSAPRVGEPPPTAPGPEPGRTRVGADGGGTHTAPFLSPGSRRPLPERQRQSRKAVPRHPHAPSRHHCRGVCARTGHARRRLAPPLGHQDTRADSVLPSPPNYFPSANPPPLLL